MPKAIFLPCRDSPEMAEQRRHELAISRDKAADLGASAIAIVTQGFYVNSKQEKIDISMAVKSAVANKISVSPSLNLEKPDRRFEETRIQVSNETTLQAARRLAEKGYKVLALNFANGKTPGGGFLNGARAQEECLCRSSALYQTLVGDPMYRAHAARTLPDSTDWTILSPDVPVFRSDDGTMLDAPYLMSFLTCAAPYAPKVGKRESAILMESRIHRVLEISLAYGYNALELGAWGCGAFDNDPVATATAFRDELVGAFSGAFEDIVFAITDWSPERKMLGSFRDVLSH